ncbi:hypothetical protein AC481_04315 [miscellaneous Crenarchaeota group archaeon SMTZ-80]|nr:MAG: hypothetical protein AC481_04315 [miscellaneous Crenarchaeota group archaeon SMTZ-80]
MKKSTKSTFILVLMTLGVTLGFLAFVVQPASTWSRPKTFLVSPSGGDDTANIQAAFNDAIATGQGCIVQLTAGQFYANNIIVQNFNGVFKGAGMDLTKIDTLRGLNPSLAGIELIQTDPEDPSTLYPFSIWFLFEDCDIKICDLTFEITALDPAYPWQTFYETSTAVSNIVRIAGHSNSLFKSVKFKGHNGNAQGNVIGGREYLNEPGGFMISADPVYGKHRIISCSFEDTMTSFVVAGLLDGKLSFINNKLNSVSVGIQLIDNFGSILEFSYNELSSCVEGVFILHGDIPLIGVEPDVYQQLGSYRIRHNTIQALVAGIEIMDFDTLFYERDTTIKAKIYHNDIIMEEDSFAGIYGFWVHDVQVICNEFTGLGLAGICIGIDDWPGLWAPCTNWFMIGNDMTNFQADMAPIWLGPGSSNCYVIGRNTANTVLDEGTDNHIWDLPPWWY